jgi:hypothetical protein
MSETAPCKVGDPDLTPYGGNNSAPGACDALEPEDGYVCTLSVGHASRWHVAGAGALDQVVAVWPVADQPEPSGPVTAPLPAVLAALEGARAKATPGEWRRVNGEALVAVGGPVLGAVSEYADAACIVAEHNAVPRLIAAVRAVWALADELETTGGKPGSQARVARWVAAEQLRDALASALAEEEATDA